MLTSETIHFLSGLRQNNSKAWFDANKTAYNVHWKQASASFSDRFSDLLEARLQLPVNARIFRLHRDVRFSKDKTPYNPCLRMSFIAGSGKPEEPAIMIGLDPEKLSIGMGLFAFSTTGLEHWRNLMSQEISPLLAQINEMNEKAYRFNEPDLKRVPAPFPQDHRNAEWLKRKGLNVWLPDLPVELGFGAEGPANILSKFEVLLPLYKEFRLAF